MKEIINRIENLERQIEFLDSKIQLINDNTEFIISFAFIIVSVVIGIITLVLAGAMRLYVKQTVNKKVEGEIQRRVLETMAKYPPIYVAKGIDTLSNRGVIELDENIEGIDQLEPKTLIHVAVYPDEALFTQVGNSLNPEVVVNNKGVREITLKNYHENNGQIRWVIMWARKVY